LVGETVLEFGLDIFLKGTQIKIHWSRHGHDLFFLFNKKRN